MTRIWDFHTISNVFRKSSPDNSDPKRIFLLYQERNWTGAFIKSRCQMCHDEDGDDGVVNRTDELMSLVNSIVGYKSLVEAECKDPAILTEIEESFARLTLYWHSNDFDQADTESLELLAKLRSMRAEKKKGHQ